MDISVFFMKITEVFNALGNPPENFRNLHPRFGAATRSYQIIEQLLYVGGISLKELAGEQQPFWALWRPWRD
ncbi:MAG: hypothetical protein KAW83_03325, partial [Dehalococcoidia bacterium]|nr:hypothetical protein [Dehalococcoidia bacterium]